MAVDAQNPGAKRPNPDRSKADQAADPAGDQARLQELSRKLLDLWQDHLSAIAQDPNLLAQALKLMTAAPFAWMPGFPAPGFPPHGGAGFAQPANPFTPWNFSGSFGGVPPSPPAPGAAAPAAASAAGADDLGQLRRRLAELEGRLAEFEGARPKTSEAGAGPSGTERAGKPKPGPGKSRQRAAKS